MTRGWILDSTTESTPTLAMVLPRRTLTEAGKFAENVLAPLNRIGDKSRFSARKAGRQRRIRFSFDEVHPRGRLWGSPGRISPRSLIETALRVFDQGYVLHSPASKLLNWRQQRMPKPRQF